MACIVTLHLPMCAASSVRIPNSIRTMNVRHIWAGIIFEGALRVLL